MQVLESRLSSVSVDGETTVIQIVVATSGWHIITDSVATVLDVEPLALSYTTYHKWFPPDFMELNLLIAFVF